MQVAQERLLTPVGLRSLAPGHPDYKPRYYGDLRSRDAAYHQGTVWGWLIGPFIDAWLKVHPDDGRRRGSSWKASMSTERRRHRQHQRDLRCRSAFRQRGCVAQAWSVAEALRAGSRRQVEELHLRFPHPLLGLIAIRFFE